jgi:fibrillarin-like pre-rRNA processing protein
MNIKTTNYTGIFILEKERKKYLLTKNITPGITFFNERTIKENNEEYRFFDPRRSKLCAAIIKNIKILPIKKGDKILYLGAAHGYTCSFISDIIGKNGLIFCIEFAPKIAKDLVFVCKRRNNMIPVLADANQPEIYEKRILQSDILFQDIAQRNQIQILSKNLKFLKKNGFVLLSIKAKSIDVIKNAKEIYKEVEHSLPKELKIIDYKELDPLERDHCFYICQKMR